MRENLKAARKAKGMTQQAMADELEETRHIFAFNNQLIICEDGKIFKKYAQDGLWHLSGGLSGDGYRCISIKVDGKHRRFLIHRLVAQAFIPNPKNFQQVNHIDGCKANNAASNLEWCTCSYNVRDSKKRHAQRYLTNLKAIRKQRNLPVQKVSRAVGLLQGRYQDIENAVTKPDTESAKRIEQYWGMSIDFLLCESEGIA